MKKITISPTLRLIGLVIGAIGIFVMIILLSKNSKTSGVYKNWLKSNQRKINDIKKDISERKQRSATIKENIKKSEQKAKDAQNSKPNTVDNASDGRDVIDNAIGD